jgi:hypothetical protein
LLLHTPVCTLWNSICSRFFRTSNWHSGWPFFFIYCDTLSTVFEKINKKMKDVKSIVICFLFSFEDDKRRFQCFCFNVIECRSRLSTK